MKFSEYFNLNKSQQDLDFVDVFLNKDIKLFIDPWAIKECDNLFSSECRSHIQTFFDLLIERIKNEQENLVKDMLNFCHEVKEIHLGDSIENYNGLGMDEQQTNDIYEALKASEAIETGSIQDIEDCALMIEGIDRDKISDMIANIIKFPLIKYTQEQCFLHGIDVEEKNVGYYWDNHEKNWFSIRAKLPVFEIDQRKDKLILVPKWIVRRKSFLQYGDYFEREILEFEQARHLRAGTSLVRMLKDKTLRPPFKTELKKIIKKGKAAVAEYTEKNPELLENYKKRKAIGFEPIETYDILIAQGEEEVDFLKQIKDKIKELEEIKPGHDDAYKYHNFMIGALEAIFYPNLSNPIKENPLAEKTKKVDIVFQNSAHEGFFMSLVKMSIPCARIHFECKNYNQDISNPEIDQLSGRLGGKTGKIGFLLCRKINDRSILLKRCKFILDNKGDYIITLDDKDVKKLLTCKANEQDAEINKFLEEKIKELDKNILI